MLTRRQAVIGGAACAALGAARPAQAEFGAFDGDFIGRFVGNATAVLEQPLTFTAPDGMSWRAPAGIEVNGASIPRALWTLVGSPFTGDYLRASVVHDHFCVTMERDWKATHLAFWYGCRADGLSKTFSDLLYAGVMRFGPRWRRRRGFSGGGVKTQRIEPEFDAAAFEELTAWVEANDPSLGQIDALIE